MLLMLFLSFCIFSGSVNNGSATAVSSVVKGVYNASSVEKSKDKTRRTYDEDAKVYGSRKMPIATQMEQNDVKWPQHHCRRHGTELTACSRKDIHESVTCVRARQMCDGTKNCPYGDDEHPTRCLFHRLSMDEMSRIRLAFSHLMEKGKAKKRPILWRDGDGNLRDQNGDFVS